MLSVYKTFVDSNRAGCKSAVKIAGNEETVREAAFLRKAASRSYSPYSVTSMGASASQAGRRTETLVRAQFSPFLKESSVSRPD